MCGTFISVKSLLNISLSVKSPTKSVEVFKVRKSIQGFSSKAKYIKVLMTVEYINFCARWLTLFVGNTFHDISRHTVSRLTPGAG